jgi:GNAT superfamily N-acetyltransferase
VLNESIGRLRYCTPFSVEALCGVASEIKDAMAADLWWVAAIDGRVVGFVGAFPDLSEGFGAADGEAGVADLEALRVLSDKSKRGFVAWLGVLPAQADHGVGRALLAKVVDWMQQRDFSDVWLSWELVDGMNFGELLRRDLGGAITSRDHVLFNKHLR